MIYFGSLKYSRLGVFFFLRIIKKQFKPAIEVYRSKESIREKKKGAKNHEIRFKEINVENIAVILGFLLLNFSYKYYPTIKNVTIIHIVWHK